MTKELDFDLNPAIKKLEVITKGIVSSNFAGRYKSVFKGRGLEFESYRTYTEFDDSSMIDWKATQRNGGDILVKQFIEERNLDVFFLIDVGSTMTLGTHTLPKNEFSAQIAASLSYAVLNTNDAMGFSLFTENPLIFSPPSRGQKEFFKFSKSLVNPKNYGGKFNLNKAIKFLLTYLKENSLIFIISDFLALEHNWEEALKIASVKFDLVGIMVRDPIDEEFPEDFTGQILLKDPISNKQIIISPSKSAEKYNQYVKKQDEYIKSIFQKTKSDFIKLKTNQDFVKPLIKMFNQRGEKFR